jgi:alpha-tubulin suppressor-like RCC1 family protein
MGSIVHPRATGWPAWLVAFALVGGCTLTGASPEPLRVVRTYPVDGTTDATTDTPVAVVFSRAVDDGTVTAADLRIEGVPASFRAECESAILEPTAPLAPDTTYVVHVVNAVPDAMFSFTTGARVEVLAACDAGAFAVLSDGSLWAWGTNVSGQLGIAAANSRVPMRVGLDDRWSTVSAGGGHTLGLTRTGELWAWGQNDQGQLGTGATSTTPEASPVRIGTRTDWHAIAAGGLHSLALRDDGTLWAWGRNLDGQLGVDGATRDPSPEPRQVAVGQTFVAIAAGSLHSLALRTDGTLWAWGYDYDHQLGLPSSGSVPIQPLPVQVGTASDWSAVIAGPNHTFGFRTDGALWAWGNNVAGQLGNGLHDSAIYPGTPPFQLVTPVAFRTLSSSGHTLGIGVDGGLYVWGSNRTGQLGMPDVPEVLTPTRLGTRADWEQVAVGHMTSYAVRADGTVWQWGESPIDVCCVPTPALTQVFFGGGAHARPPAVVSATAGASSLTVTWSEWLEDASYEIVLTASDGSPARTIDCAMTPQAIDHLSPGVTYTAAVRAHTFRGEHVDVGSASARVGQVGPPPELCAPYARDFCTLGGPGTINYYVPRACTCWPGTIDEGDAVLDELCGLSGSGYGCKTCTCR